MSVDAAIAWLMDQRGPAAWPYVVGRQARPEPTLLAVAAGCPAPLTWLSQTDLAWGSLMVPATLADTPGTEALRARAVERLLRWQADTPEETPGTYDGNLVGWSWVEGTFSWVEPTAWAVLGLRVAGQGQHERVQEGLKVLSDRQGRDGGWNAGTPDVLGAQIPSYLHATALTLLALPAGHPAVPSGFSFLAGLRERPTTLALAWGILAALAHDQPVDTWAAQLQARQRQDGSWSDRVDRTALAVCALGAVSSGASPLLPPSARP